MTPETKQQIDTKAEQYRYATDHVKMCRLTGYFAYSLAEKEIEELKNWKEQAISIMPAIGKALNVKLGQPIHDKILPGILDMQAEIERLNGLIEELNNL